MVEEKLKVLEPADTRTNLEDLSRKRQGRGRGRNSAGRGRAKNSDQTRSVCSALVVPSNGHMDKHYLAVLRCCDDFTCLDLIAISFIHSVPNCINGKYL